MKTDDELYNEIEKFLNKEMGDEENHSFEKELSKDSQMNYQFQLQSLANDLVIKNRLLEVADFAKTIQRQEVLKQKFVKWGRIGAVVVAAGLTGYFLVNPATQETQNEEAKIENEISQPMPDTNSRYKVIEKVEVQTNLNGSAKHKANNSLAPYKPLIVDEKAGYNNEDTVVIAPKTKVNEVEIEQKPIENKKTSESKDEIENIPEVMPCRGIVLKANIHGFETCEGASEGSISVSKIYGGKEPYQLKVVSKDQQIETGSTHLSEGRYMVMITDANNCSQLFDNIAIVSKRCLVDYQFNPQIGEAWEIPNLNKAAELTIFDGRGHMVLRKQIDPNNGVVWDGKTMEGQIQSGVFVYLLKFADGSQKQGNVTVLQ